MKTEPEHAIGPRDSSSGAPLPVDLRRTLEDIYRRVDREIASCGVTCWLRGHCCDFERSDHTLFATNVEIQHVRDLRGADFEAQSVLCPFWKNGLCDERERRPLGCRTYFCDPAFADRTRAIHERYHREIVALCERLDESYRYEPFVRALRAGRSGSG